MLKSTCFLLTALLAGLTAVAQTPNQLSSKKVEIDTSFRSLVGYFDELNKYRGKFQKESLQLPTLSVTDKYTISLANKALPLRKKQLILTNPFGLDKYPLSYSIFYQDHVISLFDPGYFACYNPDTWQRNTVLEKKLNTKRFIRHWLINDQLVGETESAEKFWQYSPQNGWQPYTGLLPFGKRPKLFEDDRYLVYNECNGEFGGRAFFVDKQTAKTHYIESVCAVWIRRTAHGYELISSLGHGTGSADKQLIMNPRLLPLWTGQSVGDKTSKRQPNATRVVFDFYGLQIFGGFNWQNNAVYILHAAGRTFLATLSDNTFTVVHPLFNDRVYTHEPITTVYDKTTLINMDFYGIAASQEIAFMLLRNNKLTSISWYERHH